jgi:hypothetical protein
MTSSSLINLVEHVPAQLPVALPVVEAAEVEAAHVADLLLARGEHEAADNEGEAVRLTSAAAFSTAAFSAAAVSTAAFSAAAFVRRRLPPPPPFPASPFTRLGVARRLIPSPRHVEHLLLQGNLLLQPPLRSTCTPREFGSSYGAGNAPTWRSRTPHGLPQSSTQWPQRGAGRPPLLLEGDRARQLPHALHLLLKGELARATWHLGRGLA